MSGASFNLYPRSYKHHGLCVVCGREKRDSGREYSCSMQCWDSLPPARTSIVWRSNEVQRMLEMFPYADCVTIAGDTWTPMGITCQHRGPIEQVRIEGTITVGEAHAAAKEGRILVNESGLTLAQAADKAFRFLAGLRLDDQPVEVQREALAVLRALGPLVNPGKART